MTDPATGRCALAHSDGAYVLGALSSTERLEFERHLNDCETCRISVAQLAGLPGLLGRVPVEAVATPPPDVPLPDTVLPALVATVRREQRRRRVALVLGAAAAVAVVAAGATAVQEARDDAHAPESAPTSTPSIAPPRSMTVVDDEGVTADVSLTGVGWGTKVDLTCTYGSEHGVSDYGGNGARFRLVLRTRDGHTERVMSWLAIPGKTLHMSGSTASLVGDIGSVEVQTEAGAPVLRLQL